MAKLANSTSRPRKQMPSPTALTAPPGTVPEAVEPEAVEPTPVMNRTPTTPASPQTTKRAKPAATAALTADPVPTPTTASAPPVTSPRPGSLAEARQRAEQVSQALPGTLVGEPEKTQQVVMNLPKDLLEPFRAKTKELGLSNAATVVYAVQMFYPDLERELGPDPNRLVQGYLPRLKATAGRHSVSMRLTKSDHADLTAIAKDLPRCRSLNHLLSTAVSMLLQ